MSSVAAAAVVAAVAAAAAAASVFPSIDQMAETEEPLVAAMEPEPQEQQGPTAADLVRQLKEPPYDAKALQRITKFFQNRRKNPVAFTYTAEGDLETKEGARMGARGAIQPAGVIPLKRFVPLEPAEREALEEDRLNRLTAVEEEYEAAKEELRVAWETYRMDGLMRDVLAANQRVSELDIQRNAIRSAVRSIGTINNPVTRDILLSQRYETRKLFKTGDMFGQELILMSYYEFKPEHDHGKYVAAEAAPAEPAEEVAAAAAAAAEIDMSYRQRLKDGRLARVFYDPKDSEVNGFLSPLYKVEFTLGDTKYTSAYQAYEAERMRELGKTDIRTTILGTPFPRTIRLAVRSIKEHPADARGLWTKIFTALYQQHPPLKEKLLATSTDALVYADDQEGPSGTGVSAKAAAAILDPAKWQGENLVGVVLETLRTRMREETLEEAPENTEARERSKTEEDVQRDKVGAIINFNRGGGFRRN